MKGLERPGDASPAGRQDGRHRRRERSRASVVDTALTLVRESGRLPSARRVAERAGLAERTVFNLFEDKDALMLAVVAAFRREAMERIPTVQRDGQGRPLVEPFFDALAAFLEDYSKVRWAVLSSRASVPDVERGVVLRAMQRAVFELVAAGGVDLERSPAIAAATRVAVDPVTWRLYRTQDKLDIAKSRAAMRQAVLALAEAARA